MCSEVILWLHLCRKKDRKHAAVQVGKDLSCNGLQPSSFLLLVAMPYSFLADPRSCNNMFQKTRHGCTGYLTNRSRLYYGDSPRHWKQGLRGST